MIDKLIAVSKKARSISIVCHRNPDADALGSMVGVKYLLKELGCENINMVCVDDIPEVLKSIFIIYDDILNYVPKSDLYVFVDCSSIEISGFKKSDFESGVIISIDHHLSHTGFGDLNIVNTDVSSTCEMVYEYLEEFKVEITLEIAEMITAGILFDTGGLQHTNTSSSTLRCLSKLRLIGVNTERINKILFKECSSKDLKMLGLIFRQAKLNSNGVLSCIISREDISDQGCSENEIKKAINFLNKVEDKKIALLGISQNHSDIKISMRTQSEEFDVSKIAHLFNGGGHKKAAGFRVEI